MEEEKGFKLSVAVPGEKLLEKMWDSLADNAIVPFLKSWLISRDGKAHAEVRRYEVLALAQAKADAVDIKSGKKRFETGGQLISVATADHPKLSPILLPNERVEPTLDIGAFVAAATVARAADLIRSEVNVAQTVIIAEEILAESLKPTPQNSVDDDWLLTWRDHVSKVSSEKLQYLWASALAGEVTAPGSFSIRTLDFLRTLSKAEAQEISEVAQYYLQGGIVKDVEPIVNGDGVSFGDLLRMQELGILVGVGGAGLANTFSSVASDKFVRVLRSHDKLLVIERDDMVDLRVPVYKFTTLGQQIMDLGNFKANTTYLRNVGQRIASQGYRVVMADVINISSNEVEFDNEEVIVA